MSSWMWGSKDGHFGSCEVMKVLNYINPTRRNHQGRAKCLPSEERLIGLVETQVTILSFR